MKMAAGKSDNNGQTFVFIAILAIVVQLGVSPHANAVEVLVIGGERRPERVYVCDTEMPKDADDRIPCLPFSENIPGIPYGFNHANDGFHIITFLDRQVLRYDMNMNPMDPGEYRKLPDGWNPTNSAVVGGQLYVVANNPANEGALLLYSEKKVKGGSPWVEVIPAGSGLKGVEDIAVGPNRLYVSSRKTDEVFWYSLKKRWGILVGAGGPEQLRGPRALVFVPPADTDDIGKLLVASGDNDQILAYDGLTGEFLYVFKCNKNSDDEDASCVDSNSDYTGDELVELNGPTGLVRAGPNGNIFVSSFGINQTSNNSVMELDIETGEVLTTFKGVKNTGYVAARANLLVACYIYKSLPMAGTVMLRGNKTKIDLDDQGCFSMDKVVNDPSITLTTVKD